MNKQDKVRCVKCRGYKRLYKIGKTDSYSTAHTGGALVDCPLCLGIGTMPNMVERNRVAEEVKAELPVPKKRNYKREAAG